MKALPDPCTRCGGKIPADHLPYRDGNGKRICVVCHVRADPDLSAIISAALERLTTR